MELNLRIFLTICVLIYFLVLAVMLKKKMLGLKYTLIWIACGLLLILFIAFPSLVFRGSAMIGISNPVNAIFFMAMVFSIVMLLNLTSIASKLNEKNLKLTQALALLEQRVYLLEASDKDKVK